MIKQVEFSSLPDYQCLKNYLEKSYDLEQFIIVYVDHVICITIMLLRNLSQSSPVKQVKVGTKPGHSAHIWPEAGQLAWFLRGWCWRSNVTHGLHYLCRIHSIENGGWFSLDKSRPVSSHVCLHRVHQIGLHRRCYTEVLWRLMVGNNWFFSLHGSSHLLLAIVCHAMPSGQRWTKVGLTCSGPMVLKIEVRHVNHVKVQKQAERLKSRE